MPAFDFVVETPVSTSVRGRQLGAMFDVPQQERCRIEFKGSLPIEDQPWNVGLIVGPSGCGKSTLLSRLFDLPPALTWGAAGVVDDFNPALSMEDISGACQAVGFNTIPAWLRPYAVLSNGEKFRVELARRLIETSGTIVMDEFTSVVDRQVAQIGSHAAQKYVRKQGKQFVAASCHYDIIDWLQPDWTFEPATMTYQRRSLQRRPQLRCEIRRVPWSYWHQFAPFHYMSADLNKAAKCFALWVENRLAVFMAMLYMPHATTRGLYRCSRLVTLPDFQGLGLAFVLADRVGSIYAAAGKRLRCYPAHPSFVRSFDRSKLWKLEKKPGTYVTPNFTSLIGRKSRGVGNQLMGVRPCAIFEYCGPKFEDRALARVMLA